MGRLPSFRERAAPHTLPEKMDGETDFATLKSCLASLATVNALSLGYRPTLRFVAGRAAAHKEPRPFRVLDVGSGYGDTLRVIARRFERDRVRSELTGADLNPLCVKAARSTGEKPGKPVVLAYVTRDARELSALGEAPDVIMSSLLTHHLEDDDVVEFLRWMDATAKSGWLINDLYRSRFAAEGFRLLATLLRRHPYVRHDGPVSFARAFRRADWERLLAAAGISGAKIFIGAPFRLCVAKVRGDGA